MSRAAFEARFPDEAACAAHLTARRWPDGFVCPACGGRDSLLGLGARLAPATYRDFVDQRV